MLSQKHQETIKIYANVILNEMVKNKPHTAIAYLDKNGNVSINFEIS